jgi:hypothetical protein
MVKWYKNITVAGICMKPPCELVVSKVLPSIRAAIVKVLIDDYKMKQTEVSEILGITQSSVSQYITSARAGDDRLYDLFPEIRKYAHEISDKIVKSGLKSSRISLCIPCQKIRRSEKFCNLHKEFSQLTECKICYTEPIRSMYRKWHKK